MKQRASEDLLGELHLATAKHLLNKIKSGEASPAEVSAAIKFLKDNNIEAVVETGSELGKLAQALTDKYDEETEYPFQ